MGGRERCNYPAVTFFLCRVKVQAYSSVSGSPVDEKTLLQVSTSTVSLVNVSILCVFQLHSDELLVGIQDKIMEATVRITAPPTTVNCSDSFPSP